MYTPKFILITLLFYSYSAHRDLHSFPTRRSSDLQIHVHRAVERGFRRGLQGGQRSTRVAAGDADDVVERRLGEILDRKSTRLNSSHVEISYAVFCLKKKIRRILRLVVSWIQNPSS